MRNALIGNFLAYLRVGLLVGFLVGFLLGAVFFVASVSSADSAHPNVNPLVLHTYLSATKFKSGASVPVRIQLELDPQYHAYKDQFDLKVIQPAGAKVSAFTLKPVVTFFDKVSKSNREGIHENGDMLFTLTLPDSLPAGENSAEFEVRFQACANDHCLFPKKIITTASYTIIANSGQIQKNDPQEQDWDIETLLTEKSWRAFLAVFFFGILTSFTPCIFPMIPITLSVIGARTMGQTRDEKSKSAFSIRGLALGCIYVLGIALTYALLGLFAAKTGALFGSLLGNPVVVVIIAAVFVLMGLSMYGLFDLQVPAFIRDSIGAKHTDAGFGGAFLSGLIAGVVAGPCVGPVLIGVLTFVARTQNLFFGFGLLFTYAIGMGLIFIVLGAFSGLLNKLPRSGSWMDVSKFIFGSSMVALALYYLKPVVSPRLEEALIAITMVLIASFYGAFESNQRLSVAGRLRKGIMILTLICGLAFAVKAAVVDESLKSLGATANSGDMQPSPSSSEQPSTPHLPWKVYSAAEFDKARSLSQPLILDFSADWCQACKELERYTYSDPRVQAEASHFQLFSFDATSESAQLTDLRKQYGILGLPVLLFFGKDGKWKTNLTLTGFESADEFLARMKKDEL